MLEGRAVRVDVHAEEGGAITVFDAALHVVACGEGRVTTDLRPGLYKLRVGAASVMVEDFVEIEEARIALLSNRTRAVVEAGGTIRVPEVPFPSPIPLPGARRTEAAHEAAMRALEWRGEGARRTGLGRAVLFCRASSSPDLTERWSETVSLRDAGGIRIPTTLVERSTAAGEICLGYAAELAPGFYRLREERGDRFLEQAIHVVAGWQTLVCFLPTGSMAPWLSSASVVCSKGNGAAETESWTLAERARLALEGRRRIDAARGWALAAERLDNPMLGLYSGHLVLLEPRFDEGLVQEIVTNLRRSLGVHPDVEALALAAKLPVREEAFGMPPLLVASWSRVLKATARRPALVADGSPAAKLAPYMRRSGGVFLQWREEEARRAVAGATQPLRSEEALVLAHLRAIRHRESEVVTRGGEPVPSFFEAAVEGLALPAAVIRGAMESLRTKLTPVTRAKLFDASAGSEGAMRGPATAPTAGVLLVGLRGAAGDLVKDGKRRGVGIAHLELEKGSERIEDQIADAVTSLDAGRGVVVVIVRDDRPEVIDTLRQLQRQGMSLVVLGGIPEEKAMSAIEHAARGFEAQDIAVVVTS